MASAQPEPLRVALVSTERGWHGGEQQAYLLVRGLRDRGHTCRILARRGGAFAERTLDAGFPVDTFTGSGRGPLAISQIRRCLVRSRPHVLHMNDSHALTGAGLASFGLRVPARIASRRVHFPVRSATRYRYLCDRMLCVSRAVAEACRQSGIDSGRIVVVHDGVDPGRIAGGSRTRGRRTLGLHREQPLLLTVATLTECKGHVYLLEAMPQIVRRYPQVCLALAGDGELTGPLQQQAARLGVDANVRFLGYRSDVPDLIEAADLFVMPSHLEGLCSSLIDAMLAGRPIVTTTAGGIPDLVGNDRPNEPPLAWMVPPRDPAALAEAILEALGPGEECAERSQRAQRRAERRFTADHMVEATLAAYGQTLQQAAALREAS